MIIFGVILLIVAVIFFFISRSQSSKLHAMNAADTYTTNMLADVHRNVTSSLGGDALAEPCEVEGLIEADQPLIAPISGTPCVAYTVTVTREYEQEEAKTDANGNTTTNMVKHTEQVESNTEQIDFWINDNNGRVKVRPEGASLDLKQTKEQYTPADQSTKEVKVGPFSFQVNPNQQGKTRTLGYKTVEHLLETGINVYILGCACDHQGEVAVGRHPRDKKSKFMVSRRSERELAGSAAATAKNMLYAAAGTGAVGLILLVLGIL